MEVWVQKSPSVLQTGHLGRGQIQQRSPHLSLNDGSVPIDGVRIELDPQVSGTNSCQLWWGDRHWGLWGTKRTVSDIHTDTCTGVHILAFSLRGPKEQTSSLLLWPSMNHCRPRFYYTNLYGAAPLFPNPLRLNPSKMKSFMCAWDTRILKSG